MIEGYMTVKEACEKWGLSVRWINTMCNNGRIPGVKRFGYIWAIPADTEKPTQDRRLKTGEYKDWRKKYGKNKASGKE